MPISLYISRGEICTRIIVQFGQLRKNSKSRQNLSPVAPLDYQNKAAAYIQGQCLIKVKEPWLLLLCWHLPTAFILSLPVRIMVKFSASMFPLQDLVPLDMDGLAQVELRIKFNA